MVEDARGIRMILAQRRLGDGERAFEESFGLGILLQRLVDAGQIAKAGRREWMVLAQRLFRNAKSAIDERFSLPPVCHSPRVNQRQIIEGFGNIGIIFTQYLFSDL